MPQETIFIGFGSNLGDRQELCDRAIALMNLLPLSRVIGVSSYYETEPVDPEGKAGTKLVLQWCGAVRDIVESHTSFGHPARNGTRIRP